MRRSIRIEFCMIPEEVERFHLKDFQRRMAKELTPQIAGKIVLNREIVNRPDFWNCLDLSVHECRVYRIPGSNQKAIVMEAWITKATSAFGLARCKIIWLSEWAEYPWMDETESSFDFRISSSERIHLCNELPRILPKRRTADQTGLPFDLVIYNDGFSDGEIALCMKEPVGEERLSVLRKNAEDFMQVELLAEQRGKIDKPIHSVSIKSRKPTARVVAKFDLGSAGYEGLLRLLRAFSESFPDIGECVVR